MDGTKAERLEVFVYTHPRWYLALIWSAIVVASVGVMVIMTAGLREFLTTFFSWTLPVAIGFVIYAAAVIGMVHALKCGERLKQAPKQPSLVADSMGLVTQWSARVPWTDAQDFTTGSTRGTSFFCVLVSDIGAYPHPWWTSRTFARWEPANALPMLLRSTLGYLVRRGALGPLEHVRNDQIIAELRRFRSHLGVAI